MPATFCDVTPMVPAGPDLAAAIELYTKRLGFVLEWHEGAMACVRRGGVTFNLVRNESKEWASNASFSIGVTDLDALYREYRRPPLRAGKIEVKPWGRREFHIIVAPGVCLEFFQAN